MVLKQVLIYKHYAFSGIHQNYFDFMLFTDSRRFHTRGVVALWIWLTLKVDFFIVVKVSSEHAYTKMYKKLLFMS